MESEQFNTRFVTKTSANIALGLYIYISLFPGPGPGAYLLPPLTGYENHDIRKRRPPAYSLAKRMDPLYKIVTPGPQYAIEKNYTRYGKDGTPAYTMRPKTFIMSRLQIPGPGAHSPELCPRMKEIRPPAYSMSSRTNPRKVHDNPSPAQYELPKYLGPNIPLKPSLPAYSLGNRERGVTAFPTPSPSEYTPVMTEIYKRRYPQYTMGARLMFGCDRTPRPGPAAYYPTFNQCREPPNFSFGIKHSRYMKPVILECDN
ncbi:hypothetical protein R5R35_009571 [Gryllus longicercus]|uniref:Uncharacterized protein n=2 Tax=Gryllus longicercus TaxID=2509291 RepID=A0AAN9VW07_9ORTH